MTQDTRYLTGSQLKSKVDDGSDPLVEYFRKGSAASHLSVDDFNSGYFGAARHLHLSCVASALSESSLAQLKHSAKEICARGKTLSFDPNLRSAVAQRRGDAPAA
nr:2-dehydro-3-deoxygluconokinase [Candidatus Pantoea persica]